MLRSGAAPPWLAGRRGWTAGGDSQVTPALDSPENGSQSDSPSSASWRSKTGAIPIWCIAWTRTQRLWAEDLQQDLVDLDRPTA